MPVHTRLNRRDFIVSTSAAAVGLAARSETGPKDDAPRAFRSPAGALVPFDRDDLFRTSAQRTFAGPALGEIAFPLGGIGTGTLSLGGRGQLRDFEMFNRPGKGKILPFTFVALWARAEGEAAKLRVVEGPLQPPYAGGFGFPRSSAQGLPRFQAARFTGAYPFARVDFEDDSLPVEVSLEAFNPFVPLDVDDSSLPLAVFHYRVRSRSARPVEISLAFSMLNAAGYDGLARLNDEEWEGFGGNLTALRTESLDGRPLTGLDMTSSKYWGDNPRNGSLALATTSAAATARPVWEGRDWFDSFQKWINEFAVAGRFAERPKSGASEDGRSTYGTLAPTLRLAPGASETVTFLLAWHFPVRANTWNREPEVKGQVLHNDYGRRFASAWEVARHAASRLPRLEARSRSFHDALFGSTLPASVLDAVSSQASIVRTNTGLLLDQQRFFGFEGCGDDGGCCPMNCTHVWNYEQALAFLFPSLERGMRETDFLTNTRADGSMAFRTLLPTGRALWKFRPAADGQMGSVLKLYREWQISGDDAFLRLLWPKAKAALEYAWVSWDKDRDGVMEGEQHNTYDIEFYGPNTMMGTLYLGALKAGAILAEAVGDPKSAAEYRRVFESGRRQHEALWNGEYYVQRVPSVKEVEPLLSGSDESWHANAVVDGELRYQYGKGCLADQLLGQWFCAVAGLGHVLDPEHVRTTLASIYRHNFRHDFYEHPNAQRLYALGDEKGLVLCTWPRGERPSLPFVYADEVWTGIEYQVAAHLVYEGHVAEGLAVVRGVRDRYDGQRRNPWNEVECGSHYARALASWSVLLALSGFSWSAPERRLSFAPRVNERDFRCFFSAGTGWGVFRQKLAPSEGFAAGLETRFGEVRLRHLRLANPEAWTSVVLRSATGAGGAAIPGASVRREGDALAIDFGTEIVVAEGQSLGVTLAAG